MEPFFSYVHARPNTKDAHGIFYVGKGYSWRARSIGGRNPYYTNIVKKHGKENILIGTIECSSEQLALDLERGLIKCLKRMGVRLANQTDGGEGTSNPSPELRAKLQPNWDRFTSEIAKRNRDIDWTPELRLKVSIRTREAMKDKNVKQAIAAANRRRVWSPKARAKVGAFHVGNQHTLGNRWITDGINSKQIGSTESPPAGWKFGRFMPWRHK